MTDPNARPSRALDRRRGPRLHETGVSRRLEEVGRPERRVNMLGSLESVATITPVLNDADHLTSAVRSIQQQRGMQVAAIVVSVGPSHDGSLAVAKRLAAADPRIRVVENPSGRTSVALNLGMEMVGDAEIIARVDARSVLPPDYLSQAVETLHRTGAGNVGAIQNPVGHTRIERAIAEAMQSMVGSGGAAYRHAGLAREVDTAWLGVFRRSAIEDVGGWDESFERNQDAELNLRLANAGHRVWLDPRLVVDYRPRSTFLTLARQYRDYGWWRCRTIHKHPGSVAPRQIGPPLLVLVLVGTAAASLVWSRLLALVPAAYGVAVLSAGMATRGPLSQRVTAGLALATMHLCWGVGFLGSAAGLLSRCLRSRT